MLSFTKESLKELLKNRGELSISIYMPTVKAGKETEQNPIRFKNLLKDVETQLNERGFKSQKIAQFLRPAYDYLEDSINWQYQDEGFAMFLADGYFLDFKLPVKCEEIAFVGDRFYIKPIIPLINSSQQYYLLTLSLNGARLFICSQYDITEMDIPGLDQDMNQALNYVNTGREVHYHTQLTGKKGVPAAIFHGQGFGLEDIKEDIAKYFHIIDNSVQNFLQNENYPLVLAGAEYLVPIYRETNSYAHTVDGGILRNPKEMDLKELHERSWEIVEPLFRKAEISDIKKYEDLSNTNRISGEIREILPASVGGKVDILFTAGDLHLWGRFNQEENSVVVHTERGPEDEELLDLSAFNTILNGGKVYVLDKENIPSGTLVAAVYRF
ncbi:MAG: hypothetical protein DRP87_05135 [Spirochaetes bacterium]|nr:MAG: hypothetical protein DRP87_05135 [Spirochaetota bacterium]